MKMLAILTLAASAAVAMPLSASAQNRTVTVSSPFGISAVYDPSTIAMQPLPGGRADLGYEVNPAFFQGASLCVAGLNGNWPIRRDGTLHEEPPVVRSDGSVERRSSPRTPSCALIVNGRATVDNPFGPDAVPFILRDGRIIGWAGRDRLTGLAS